MRTYSFTEARQKFAELLDAARTEDILIQRRGGETFVVSVRKKQSSPFDDVQSIPGVQVGMKAILEAVRFSRAQPWRDTPRTRRKKK